MVIITINVIIIALLHCCLKLRYISKFSVTIIRGFYRIKYLGNCNVIKTKHLVQLRYMYVEMKFWLKHSVWSYWFDNDNIKIRCRYLFWKFTTSWKSNLNVWFLHWEKPFYEVNAKRLQIKSKNFRTDFHIFCFNLESTLWFI